MRTFFITLVLAALSVPSANGLRAAPAKPHRHARAAAHPRGQVQPAPVHSGRRPEWRPVWLSAGHASERTRTYVGPPPKPLRRRYRPAPAVRRISVERVSTPVRVGTPMVGTPLFEGRSHPQPVEMPDPASLAQDAPAASIPPLAVHQPGVQQPGVQQSAIRQPGVQPSAIQLSAVQPSPVRARNPIPPAPGFALPGQEPADPGVVAEEAPDTPASPGPVESGSVRSGLVRSDPPRSGPARNRILVQPGPEVLPPQPAIHATVAANEPPDPAPDEIPLPVLSVKGKFAVPPPLRGSRDSLIRQNERTEAEGLERILDDEDLADRIAQRALIPLPASSALTVNPNLPQDRRYCRPWTAKFLSDLARDHAAQFQRPLLVSSAVRTVAYQKQLARINGNAAPAEGDIVSPHVTGATIDIAKEQFTRQELGWMRTRLLALEDAGKIDVEEEFQQACFHITVYKSYAPPRGPSLRKGKRRNADAPAEIASRGR